MTDECRTCRVQVLVDGHAAPYPSCGRRVATCARRIREACGEVVE